MSERSEPRAGRVRPVFAAVLGALAVVSLMATTVAVWAKVTVFDADEVAGIVGDALAEPEVTAALAHHVTDAVFSAVDVDAAVGTVLPDRFRRLGPLLEAGARSAVDRTLATTLASPDVQAVLTEAVKRAHTRAMDLLQGGGLADGITVGDGAVSVNLLPLVARGLIALQDVGLFGNVVVPDLDRAGDPQQQISELEQATGRDLPDDFGQLVVYRSDRIAAAQASLETAQRTVTLAKRAVWMLAVLTIALLALTLVVARHRWRAALLLGLAGAVAMVLVRALVHRVVDDAPDLVTDPGARAAIAAIVDGASTGLLRLAGMLLVVSVAVVAVSLVGRRWPRVDLVAVGAALGIIVVVATLGFSLGALALGLLAAAAVAVAGWFLRPASAISD